MTPLTRSALALMLGAASMSGLLVAQATVADDSARRGTGDPTVLGACAKEPDATVERAHCLGELAAQNRDAMFCRETRLRGRKGYAGPLFETCFAAFARGTGDPELCAPLEAFVDSAARGICLAYMAREKGSASVCAGDGLCVAHLAGLTGDASLCEPIGFDDRQHCLYKVAAASADFERCAEIQGSWNLACYRDTAALLGQPEICERIVAYNEPGRSACYTFVAMALLDPSVCNHVTEARPRAGCIIRVAAERGDSDLCAALTHPIERPKCYLQVAKATTDLELCSAIETSSDFGKQAHDECVAHMSRESGTELREEQLLLERERAKHRVETIVEAGNPDRCAELRNYRHGSRGVTIRAKDQCYEAFARGEPRVARCDWELERDACVEMARGAARPKLCNKVDDDRDECYWHAARVTRNATVCDEIREVDPMYSRSRQACYVMIAVISGDGNGCRRVQDEELRSECLAHVALFNRPLER